MTTSRLPARRRHATMACVSCRESKVKCDAKEPACSNCVTRHRECRYHAVDKRKLPLRVAVELLSSRVNQLCLFIRENGLEAPEMPEEKNTALTKVLDILGLNEVNSTHTQPSESVKDASCFSGSVPFAATPTVTDEFDNFQSSPGDTTETTQNAVLETTSSHDVSGSVPIVDEGAIGMPAEQPQLTAENPESVMNSTAWDLDLGICITPPTSDVQNLDFPTSPTGTLGALFEEMPEPINPVIVNDASTGKDTTKTAGMEDLIDELSDRVGKLHVGPGGQPHFYGPTSTFNLADAPIVGDFQKPHTLDGNMQKGLDTDEEVPVALEEHLISLYFSWQDPSSHVVDREMFEDAKAKSQRNEDTQFYSGALRYAVCALGAAFETRYHPSFVTFPKSLLEFFGNRAKELLDLELDCPCVATVQALIILSSHEIGNGNDARGWLYSGMAIRLAFDLALHLDMSGYVSNGFITAADAELRRTVFWAAYTVDHNVGFHLGRPFYTNMDDVTVGKPNDDVNHQEPRKWIPYESPNSDHSGEGILDSMEEVTRQEVSLCELMARCGYILYGTSGISKAVLQQLNENFVSQLLNWKAKLPQGLQIDLNDHNSPYLPHVLILHMQYYQNMIYAHRPWMSKSHLQPQPPKGPGYNHAREMCIHSAISIAKILLLYENRYTLRRISVKAVSIISSAVPLLLFAAVSQCPLSEQEDVTAHLSTCFRALDESSLSWQSAARAKDLLVRLQCKWELRTRAGKTKPGLAGDSVFVHPRKKRSRTSNGNSAEDSTVDKPSACAELGEPDLNADSGMSWMFMLTGQLPDGGDEELYSFISDAAISGSEYDGI